MFSVSVLVLERKHFFREKNLKKIKNFEILKIETPPKIQFSTFFRFSFFKIIFMIYIFIVKFQIVKNWVPSILFRKNRKNRRIRGKPAKISNTVQYKKF